MRRLALIAALAVAAAAHAAEVLDNAAVMRLARAGLSSEVILLKIEQSDARFDLSTDALIELKSAGVADAVIKTMMLKTPHVERVLNPSGPAESPSHIDTCAKLSLYTLGNNGWEWVPSSVCVSATRLSVDEQSFAFAELRGQCIELPLIPGDVTWRFSDGKESLQLRGQSEDVRKMSDALAAAAPAVRHGKCSERGMRAALSVSARGDATAPRAR
jgi:hypothetical protein